MWVWSHPPCVFMTVSRLLKTDKAAIMGSRLPGILEEVDGEFGHFLCFNLTWQKTNWLEACLSHSIIDVPAIISRWATEELSWHRIRDMEIFIFIFIVIQLQLSAFSPHPSTPPQPNPPPYPAFILPLDFVHVSFIVVPVNPSPHCPLAIVRLFLTSMRDMEFKKVFLIVWF